MDAARALFWPAFAMVLLTFVVLLRMFTVRIGEMRRLRISPQGVATSAQTAQLLGDTRAAVTFRNLFELPVLFYVALGAAFAIGAGGPATLALAWLFVVLRVAHGVVQCSYSRVMHRFAVYAVAGAATLGALWINLAWHLAR